MTDENWYYCPRCDFPNDKSNYSCSECGQEFDERENSTDEKDNDREFIDEPRCPICATSLDYDAADIGVGIQTGNHRCEYCGWSLEQDEEQYYSCMNGVEV